MLVCWHKRSLYVFAVGVDPANRNINGKTLRHHGVIHGVFTEDLISLLACEGVFEVCATPTDSTCTTSLDYAEKLAHRE